MNACNNMKKISLDSRTVLLGSSIQDILRRTNNKRKGIDFRLYTVAASGKESPNQSQDIQTVLTMLSSMHNPDPSYQQDKDSQDRLLAESLDKILISDRVRSCKDFYRTNNKKDMDSSNSMRVSY